MALPNIFTPETTAHYLERLEKLKPDTVPQWGEMDAAQMLAHLCVAYDIAYGNIEVSYNPVMRFMFKLFLKPLVVGNKPYQKNSRTAPAFKIREAKVFETEKERLIQLIKDTEARGETYFEGKFSSSFGKLSSQEWSTQFTKHMEHHFTQFGI